MAEPITLDFLKQHTKITVDREDELLAVYLTAARQRAESYCNRYFASQVATETLPINQVAPVAPEAILSVTGAYSTLAEVTNAYNYFVEYQKGISVNRQYPIDYDNLPTYTISYQVTVAPEDVPAAVKVAIAKIARDLYENRENSGSQELGITAKTMLAAYRKF
jgi:hypothetical protein